VGGPVAGATVHLTPPGMTIVTDGAGKFEVDVPINGSLDYITEVVEAAGLGTWTRLGERLEAGVSYTVEVFMDTVPQTTQWHPPLAEVGSLSLHSLQDSDRIGGGKFASLIMGTSVYSDQSLAPPSIRVSFVPSKDSSCNYTGSYPPAYSRTQTYGMDYYLRQVTMREFGTSTYPDEAVKAVAAAVKNFAWYWVNQGGRSYTPNGDVDDAANDYQCFDPGLNVSSKVNSAVDATLGIGLQKPSGSIWQSQYQAGSYDCTNSDGSYMDQNGARAWVDLPLTLTLACVGQTSKLYDWILHHYYDATPSGGVPGPMVIFSTAAPIAPFVTYKRPDETPVVLHFEAQKGAWQYEIERYDPVSNSWPVQVDLYVDPQSGQLATEWTDSNVTAGTQYDYAVFARGSAAWSPFTIVTAKAWTTDLWNASFEHAYFNGDRARMWTGNNNPIVSVVSPGWDGNYALRFSPQPGSWASAFQDVYTSNSTFCPIGVVRRPSGYTTATVTLTIWGLGGPSADEQFQTSWSVPSDNNWYSLALDNPRQCHTFTGTHSYIRYEIYNGTDGPIDTDYERLVYNATTYERY
jgi:stage II sporulation SpoD-like protein